MYMFNSECCDYGESSSYCSPPTQDKVVEQWPGLMMEEYAVLSEKNGDYQRISNDTMEAQNGMLLPGHSSPLLFFDFVSKMNMRAFSSL
jgi:hypothetical protein